MRIYLPALIIHNILLGALVKHRFCEPRVSPVKLIDMLERELIMEMFETVYFDRQSASRKHFPVQESRSLFKGLKKLG